VPKTSIEWTDVSWPLANGCRRISPGCENCYAERLTATRLSKTPKYQGLAVFGQNGPRWTGRTRLWEADLFMPIRLRKPSRIFVADMGDLFYEGFTDQQIAAVFGVMAAAPRHTFQMLTKRADRMARWFDWVVDRSKEHRCRERDTVHRALVETSRGSIGHGKWEAIFDNGANPGWPLPNVHLGVSAESQKYADERIPLLLQTPAALRWISAEPLLGPVDVSKWLTRTEPARIQAFTPEAKAVYGAEPIDGTLTRSGIDWVVVGGESGSGAREFRLSWAKSLIERCRSAKVPVFMKQVGANVTFNVPGYVVRDFASRKGGDPSEWPEDLRVREMPAGGR
jgi:protein gp37